MSAQSLNARNGLSVGTIPTVVIDTSGNITAGTLTAGLTSLGNVTIGNLTVTGSTTGSSGAGVTSDVYAFIAAH
jgi:hypothetical protein